MNENPFIFGSPVSRENFYNRKEEIEAAMGFLKKMQSFSVVGERRIGKTSFLKHILSKESLQRYGINPENHVVVCFSLSSLHEISKKSLISAIIEKIAVSIQIETDSANVFDEFKAHIRSLALNGKNLIVALDEFDVIVPILDDSFSHWLRFIFQKENVAAAITVSQTTVRELESSGGVASPLFNIFSNIFLGLFKQSVTENMITDMFQKGGMNLEEEEIAFLLLLSGGNPYFIQFLGHHYYEEKRKNRKVVSEEFRKNMLLYMNDQFESYWKHLTREEKKFLDRRENSKNDQISSILERKGFVFSKKGKFKIFSLLFQEFINNRAKIDKDLIFD